MRRDVNYKEEIRNVKISNPFFCWWQKRRYVASTECEDNI